MRLQISVQRHNLPSVNLVFATGTGPTSRTLLQNATIADLLHDLNEIVPLESADGEWGIEDYVVDLDYSTSPDSYGGAYECLHFLPIESVLREDDTVTVRGISTEELREKRLGGRLQISKDGRHLIDGVAFGKRWLRNNARPGVVIPPRKKRLSGLEDHQENQNLILDHDEEQIAKALIALPFDAEDESYDEEDEDFLPKGEKTVAVREIFENTDSASEDGSFSEDSHEDISGELRLLLKDASDLRTAEDKTSPSNIITRQGGRTNLKRKRQEPDVDGEVSRKVTFKKIPDSRKWPEKSSYHDSDSSSEISSSSDMSNSAESTRPSNGSTVSSKSESSSLASDSTSSSDSESDSDWTSSSGSSSAPEDESVKDRAKTQNRVSSVTSSGKKASQVVAERQVPTPTPPGNGSAHTSKRNARAKVKKRLQALKSQGVLPSDASFEDMYQYEQAQTQNLFSTEHINETVEHGIQAYSTEAIRQQVLGRLQVRNSSSLRPEDLISSPENIEIQLKTPKSNRTTQDGPDSANETPHNVQTNHLASVIQSETKTQSKRPKLDLASSRRMLFSSLGVRAPKTPAEEEALRSKLAKTVQKHAQREANDTVTDKLNAQDLQAMPVDDTWKSKLIVSAIECEQDGVHLEPPPFPFQQGWWKSANKKIKHKEAHQSHSAYTVHSPQEMTAKTSPKNDGQVESGEQPIVNDLSSSSQAVDEVDRVPIPQNFDSLPSLGEKDLAEDAIIAYKELHLNQSTNFQPEISAYKIARIARLQNEDKIDVIVANCYREVLPRHDLDSGRRLHSKFEISAVEDDDSIDDGFREVSFANLIEPKLVRAHLILVPESQAKSPTRAGTVEDLIDGESAVVADSVQQPDLLHDSADALPSEAFEAHVSGRIMKNGIESSQGDHTGQINNNNDVTSVSAQLSAQLQSSAQQDHYLFEHGEGQEYNGNSLVSLQLTEVPTSSNTTNPVVDSQQPSQEVRNTSFKLKPDESWAERNAQEGDMLTTTNNGTMREDSPDDLIECVVPDQVPAPEKEASLSFHTSASEPLQDTNQGVADDGFNGADSYKESDNAPRISSSDPSTDQSFISLKYPSETSQNAPDMESIPRSMNLRKRRSSKDTHSSRTHVSMSPSLDPSIPRTDASLPDRTNHRDSTEDDTLGMIQSDASINTRDKSGRPNQKTPKPKHNGQFNRSKARASTTSSANGKKGKDAFSANKKMKI